MIQVPGKATLTIKTLFVVSVLNVRIDPLCIAYQENAVLEVILSVDGHDSSYSFDTSFYPTRQFRYVSMLFVSWLLLCVYACELPPPIFCFATCPFFCFATYLFFSSAT